MAKPTLLIADSNEDFRWQLALSLEPYYQILECETGMEALRLLRDQTPDILVLEILLPELDGFTLLEWIAAEGICPRVLALTPLMSEYEQLTAQRLGIAYLMRKGGPIQALVTRIRDMTTAIRSAKPVDPVQWVKAELARFPVKDTYKGYPGLETAIVLFEKNPEQSFTNELYVETAKACKHPKGSIERNARTALDHAWEHGDPAVWQEYFPGATQRPEVSEFIRRMAQALHKALE